MSIGTARASVSRSIRIRPRSAGRTSATQTASNASMSVSASWSGSGRASSEATASVLSMLAITCPSTFWARASRLEAVSSCISASTDEAPWMAAEALFKGCRTSCARTSSISLRSRSRRSSSAAWRSLS
jgi:hypothetical protein